MLKRYGPLLFLSIFSLILLPHLAFALTVYLEDDFEDDLTNPRYLKAGPFDNPTGATKEITIKLAIDDLPDPAFDPVLKARQKYTQEPKLQTVDLDDEEPTVEAKVRDYGDSPLEGHPVTFDFSLIYEDENETIRTVKATDLIRADTGKPSLSIRYPKKTSKQTVEIVVWCKDRHPASKSGCRYIVWGGDLDPKSQGRKELKDGKNTYSLALSSGAGTKKVEYTASDGAGNQPEDDFKGNVTTGHKKEGVLRIKLSGGIKKSGNSSGGDGGGRGGFGGGGDRRDSGGGGGGFGGFSGGGTGGGTVGDGAMDNGSGINTGAKQDPSRGGAPTFSGFISTQETQQEEGSAPQFQLSPLKSRLPGQAAPTEGTLRQRHLCLHYNLCY